MSVRLAVLACTALALGLAASAYADDGESSSDRFSVQPSLRLTVVGTDNSEFERDDGKDGIATWLEPRVELDWERRDVKLGVDLSADLRIQDGYRESRAVFYDVRGFGEWSPWRGVTLRLANQWLPQALRLGVPADDTANLTQSNRLLAEVRFSRDGVRQRGVELGLRGTDFRTDGFPATLDLDGDGLLEDIDELHADHQELLGWVETRWGLGRRATVYLRGEGRRREFDELPRADLSEWSGFGGLRGQFGKRIELDAAIGYGRIDFDDLPTDERLLGRLNLDWDLPRGFRINALVARQITGDAAAADFDETSVRLGMTKELGAKTEASAGALWTRFRRDSPDAESDRVVAFDLGLRRQLTRRLSGRVGLRHWRNIGSLQDDDFRQNRVILELLHRF